jgi:hypothetical protein
MRALRIIFVLFLFALSGVVLPELAAGAQSEPGNDQTTLANEETSPYQIHLLSGDFEPEAGKVGYAAVYLGEKPVVEAEQALLERGQAATEKGLEKIHVLLQFEDIPTDEQKAQLSTAGIELFEYIPNNTWMASVPAQNPLQALSAPGARWMGDWSASAKLHPALTYQDWDEYLLHPEQDAVMVMVLLHGDVPLERGAVLAEAHAGVAMPPLVGVHGMTIWLPRTNLLELAAEEEIVWIEPGPAPLTSLNDGIRSSMQITPLYSTPYNLGGTGVRLFVFDAGTARATHTTFNAGAGSRVTLIDGTSSADHPTHVAGTAAGDGNDGRAEGIAPLATILSAGYQQSLGTMLFWDNAGDLEADYALARKTYGADLVNNSIGSNTAFNGYDCAREGDYGVTSNLLDGIVRGDNITVGSAMIALFANGNERTGGTSFPGRCGSNYATTAPPACAKNPIQVGAINSDYDTMTQFSSWGPCDDGRLKPVVVASGCELGGEKFIYSSLGANDTQFGGTGWCGTSMASPAASGVAVLMIEQWRALGYGGANDRPLPALVKTLLIHTARDLGQAGPDYIFGYGEVDAKAAIDFIRAGAALAGPGAQRWGTSSISQNNLHSYTIPLPAGVAELKASLAWDDRAAAAYVSVALVNDLNLEIVAPDGITIYRPWTLNAATPHQAAGTGINNRDNQEQVVVKNPAAGTWTVRVRGTSVPFGPQTYALATSASMPSYNQAACSQAIANGGFEAGTTGWTLSGASRVTAPASGHGSYSLRLGGALNSSQSAYTTITIPAGTRRAQLSYFWYMTTAEGPGHPYDFFYAQVHSSSGTVLASIDYRSDGWPSGQWMRAENLDLTPWAGQTVRVYFYATNDSSLPTSFYVDDISLELCAAPTQTWWVGSTSATNSAMNWSNGVIPTCSMDAVIPNPPLGKSAPTLNANLDVKNLIIQSGAQFNMSSNTLGVCGNWTLESGASLNATGGLVLFKGSGAQTIAGGGTTSFPALTINSTGSVNLGQSASATNVTIQAGQLEMAAHNLGVAGNWNLASGASFNASGGTVQFLGTGLQTIGGTQATSFSGLTIQNSGSGVNLNQAVEVKNLLTLNNGLLRLGNYHLTLESGVGIGGAPSATKMVVVNGSGEMRKKLGYPLSDFFFPIGEETGVVEYSPISLSFQGLAFQSGAYVGARVIDAKHPSNPSGSDYLTRYWSLTSSGISYVLANIQFTYLTSDIVGSEANIVGAIYRTPGWWMTNPVNAPANTASGLSTSLGDLTGMPASQTQVSAADLRAESQPRQVMVLWRTSIESNVSSFNIYRSATPDGTKTKLNGAALPAQYSGLSQSGSYNYVDTTGVLGVTYYYWIEVNFLGGGTAWFGPLAAYAGMPVFLPLIAAP